MPVFRIVPAAALVLALAVVPAHAQFWGNNGWGNGWGGWGSPYRHTPRSSTPSTPKSPPQTSSPSSQPAIQDQPAPYDRDLQRLSEILGALHFLRGICNNDEGQKWRTEAQALIDAEAPGGNRRDQMVASFNRGYRGFQQTYRSCTPAADIVIRRYLEEGAKIARDITARYAN
ncbi:MAG: TIGR02301 family protein [Rhizobiales bacterium]|nr:TIGR02301 family protein [Hyphomicrobiales bacterium]